MAVTVLFSAIGVLAEENTVDPYGENFGMTPPVKNECLIVAKNCANAYSNVQDRAIDLRKEISRGLDVYSPEELNNMKEQLKFIETESGNVTM
jgi:hypothetical protein